MITLMLTFIIVTIILGYKGFGISYKKTPD